MKPFDLEAFKAGKIALTRDGRRAEFVGYCAKAVAPLCAYIEREPRLFAFNADGVYVLNDISGWDITHMAPEEIVKWVNVYKDVNLAGVVYWSGSRLHDFKEIAENWGKTETGYICSVPITIKE